MKRYTIAIMIVSLLLSACGGGSSEPGDLEQKRKDLAELKAEAKELRSKIKNLELEIQAADSTFVRSDEGAITLVSVIDIPRRDFEHKTEIRGAVKSRRNVVVSAEANGRILDVNAKEGDIVGANTVLVKLDAQSLKDNIAEVEKQMELAYMVYQRQGNLWKDSIGSEIQFLQAKNNYESLQKRQSTLNTQLAYATLKAPFAGSVEEVMVKEGEMAGVGMPMFRLVSLQEMYIQADASESFVGSFQNGQEVEVSFPSVGAEERSKITAIGQVIDEGNRTFNLEVAAPEGTALKPNMTAVLSVRDYLAEDVLVLPTEIIQRDANGHYVFITAQGEDGPIAYKKTITLGRAFNGEAEITSGLKGDEQIIYQGFRDLTNGVAIKITNKVADSKLVSNNGK